MSSLGRPTKWTQDRIVVALRRYGDLIGGTPASIRMEEDRQRDNLDWLPSRQTVEYQFGSWNAAIEAAGFKPRTGRWKS